MISPGPLERYVFGASLAVLALAAFLDVPGTAAVVAARIDPDREQLAVPSRDFSPPEIASGEGHATSADPIPSRNRFDSVTEPLPPQPQRSLFVMGDLRMAIESVGSKDFNVDRRLVFQILEHFDEPMDGAKILVMDGKVPGIRLLGVRPGTLFALLGIENGDRVEKIDGYRVTVPERAKVYSYLRNAKHLTVSIDRRGRKIDLGYTVMKLAPK